MCATRPTRARPPPSAAATPGRAALSTAASRTRALGRGRLPARATRSSLCPPAPPGPRFVGAPSPGDPNLGPGPSPSADFSTHLELFFQPLPGLGRSQPRSSRGWACPGPVPGSPPTARSLLPPPSAARPIPVASSSPGPVPSRLPHPALSLSLVPWGSPRWFLGINTLKVPKKVM